MTILTRKLDFEMASLYIDLANTLAWHATNQPLEHLENYADLLAWTDEKQLLALDQDRPK